MNTATITREQFIAENKVSLVINYVDYRPHFTDEEESRFVFNCTLKANGKRYTFDFGQSIAKGDTEPTLEEILPCLTWFDPYSFEDFCDNYGYNNDSRKDEKIYRAVVREYRGVCRLFPSEEMRETASELFQ